MSRRLIRMFSFVGDTVLDPFNGTGTTTLTAIETGRNSIGYDIVPEYVDIAAKRLAKAGFSGQFTVDPGTSKDVAESATETA